VSLFADLQRTPRILARDRDLSDIAKPNSVTTRSLLSMTKRSIPVPNAWVM
jgi:hypothetical protein